VFASRCAGSRAPGWLSQGRELLCGGESSNWRNSRRTARSCLHGVNLGVSSRLIACSTDWVKGRFVASLPIKGRFVASLPVKGRSRRFAPVSRDGFVASLPIKGRFVASLPIKGRIRRFALYQGTDSSLRSRTRGRVPVSRTGFARGPVIQCRTLPLASCLRNCLSGNTLSGPSFSSVAPV